MEEVITATRFWATSQDDIGRLLAFLDCAGSYSQRIIVAINAELDTQETAVHLEQHPAHARTDVLQISPWGGVTHALNLILHQVLNRHASASYVLFQSVEAMAVDADVASLVSIMRQRRGSVLVAGHALPGHPMHGWRGDAVLRPLSADSTPWNTLAMWDAKMLGATGFPAAADVVSPPGMEEVAAIAMQQRVFGNANRQAVVFCKQGVQWDTDFAGERKQKHDHKMASKRKRANQILGIFGEGDGDVSAQVWVCAEDVIPADSEKPAMVGGRSYT